MIAKYRLTRVSLVAVVAGFGGACSDSGGAGVASEDSSEFGSALTIDLPTLGAKPSITSPDKPDGAAKPRPVRPVEPPVATVLPQPPLTGPVEPPAPMGCSTEDGAVELPAGTTASLAQDNPWYQGGVPYRFHSSVPAGSNARMVLLQAMRHYNFMTSIRFVFDANDTQSDHVLLRTDLDDGCVSKGIGFQSGAHVVNLQGDGCQNFNVAVHELGHRVGLHHEQRRADRDLYILIQDGKVHDGVQTNNNIQSGKGSQFAIYQGAGYQVGGFDFDSVMLYPSTTSDTNFAIDVTKPIITKRDGTTYANPQSSTNAPLTSGLSSGDIATLFQLYPPAALIPNNDNTCRTAPIKPNLPKQANQLVAARDGAGTTTLSQYSSTGSSFYPPKSWSAGSTYQSHAPWAAGDFNNDGLTDVAEIRSVGGLSRVVVRTAKSLGGFNAPVTWADRAGKFDAERQWLPGDFDKDGRDDLALVWRDGLHTTISVFLSTGSGFTLAPTDWSLRDGRFNPHARWTVGDFNKDGYADLAAAWNDSGYNSITVQLSTGSSFNRQEWASRKGIFGYFNKWLAADFTNDGFPDLVEIRKEGTATIARVFTSLGAGFSDPIDWISFGEGNVVTPPVSPPTTTLSTASTYSSAYSAAASSSSYSTAATTSLSTARQIATGTGTVPPVVVIDDPPAVDTARWTTGDFDNDGRADLARISSTGDATVISVLRSTGSAFTRTTWSTVAGTYPLSTQWCSGRFGAISTIAENVDDLVLTQQ